ncbi:MAG: hypothetical protein LH629_11060, partial [Ignavibacteria bacterium]|nr:hypothetical protein [Ignavibacteria bacterium]
MSILINNAGNIDTTIAELRIIISKRISIHISHETFDFNSFTSNTLSNQLINPGIAGKLPQQPSAKEWIILLLAVAPHIQANLFESIIAEH